MIRNNQKWLITLVGALILLTACSRGTSAPEPPEIRYGEDACANCSMIISDPRFAAGYAREVGPQRYESLAFDDIGDMLEHAHDQGSHMSDMNNGAGSGHSDGQIVAWYVHDYESEEWLDATTAFFVVSPQIASPMAFGISAHETRTAAEAMAQEVTGEVLDWQQLLERDISPHLHTQQE